MNLKKPFFWDFSKANYISYLLIPLTLPIIIRNFLFKFTKKYKPDEIKTICVGNIYLGGTGKTPLTIKLYEILNNLGYKVATVKKYYPHQKDEQILLKKKTSLIISKSRKNALNQGIATKYDILIFDDGLQEMHIDYDFKLVCFKSINWIGNGKLIPAGPLREDTRSLKKFDAVFLNGKFRNIHKIEKQIYDKNPKIKIFKTFYEILNVNKFDLKSKYLISNLCIFHL